ncbi:hypothetical protein BDA99DRAFT_532096 [Phascolomyces articulosus]|uniref:Uncharacterized protein n=1 Tax=Phascolomyces articulosus TaxID=60185 RepID=A0AAD5KB25_9FUNG|nr:hypothetical protein BDA99DRAFT_532096 [Phascolomyces articulosus]
MRMLAVIGTHQETRNQLVCIRNNKDISNDLTGYQVYDSCAVFIFLKMFLTLLLYVVIFNFTRFSKVIVFFDACVFGKVVLDSNFILCCYECKPYNATVYADRKTRVV